MKDDASIPQFHLGGYLTATEGREGFAVPVFQSLSSNRLVTQLIADGGRVASFRPIVREGQVRPYIDRSIKIAEGKPALWAFVHTDGRLQVAGRQDLADALAANLDDRIEPFLRLQIVQFCDLHRQLPSGWEAVYSKLHRVSPKSALAWRDVVVVPPSIRAAIFETASKYGLASRLLDLSQSVTTTVEGHRLTVTLDADLHEAFAAHPAASRTLRRNILPLRQAFGLSAETSFVPATAKPNGIKANIETQMRIVVVGERAARIATHGVSKERSVNGSVRPLWKKVILDRPVVGLVDDAGIAILTENQAFEIGMGRHATLIILVAVDTDNNEEIDIAHQIAAYYRSCGSRVIVAVPHLPNALATTTEINLWQRLGEGADAVWALSNLVAHTRQSLSYGGGQSAAAASGRFNEFVSLAADGGFPLASRPPSDQTQVCVFGGAVGDVSPRALVEHAAMRILTPSVDTEDATLAIACLNVVASEDWLDDVLAASLPSVRKMAFRLSDQFRRRGLIAVLGVSLRSVDSAEFEHHCIRALRLAGWNVHPHAPQRTIMLDSEEGPWNVIVAPGPDVAASTLARDWHEGRQELRFTDRTLGRRDFLEGVLLGSVPVNANRIPVLAKILRSRWRTALGIARDRRLDVTDILVRAAAARMVEGRGRLLAGAPPSYALSSHPEVRILADAVQAVFRFSDAEGVDSIANLQLDAGGLACSFKRGGRKT